MAQARKTFYSLGDPRYVADPRVDEAQRQQRINLAGQAEQRQQRLARHQMQQSQQKLGLARDEQEFNQALARQAQELAGQKFGLEEQRFGLDQTKHQDLLGLRRDDLEHRMDMGLGQLGVDKRRAGVDEDRLGFDRDRFENPQAAAMRAAELQALEAQAKADRHASSDPMLDLSRRGQRANVRQAEQQVLPEDHLQATREAKRRALQAGARGKELGVEKVEAEQPYWETQAGQENLLREQQVERGKLTNEQGRLTNEDLRDRNETTAIQRARERGMLEAYELEEQLEAKRTGDRLRAQEAAQNEQVLGRDAALMQQEAQGRLDAVTKPGGLADDVVTMGAGDWEIGLGTALRQAQTPEEVDAIRDALAERAEAAAAEEVINEGAEPRGVFFADKVSQDMSRFLDMGAAAYRSRVTEYMDALDRLAKARREALSRGRGR